MDKLWIGVLFLAAFVLLWAKFHYDIGDWHG
jgi:hypothetical protein